MTDVTKVEEIKRELKEHITNEGRIMERMSGLSDEEKSELLKHLKKVVSEVSSDYPAYGTVIVEVSEKIGLNLE